MVQRQDWKFFAPDQMDPVLPPKPLSFHSPISSRDPMIFGQLEFFGKALRNSHCGSSFFVPCSVSMLTGMTDFMESTRTIDFVLSHTVVSSIAALDHKCWCRHIFN
jgi:hypothetical protein